jgi:hypothetical protein
MGSPPRLLAPTAFLALVSCLAAQTVPRASLGHSGGLNPIARTLNINTVEAMLDAGEDPNLRDPDSGATLLHYAILYNRPELAKVLKSSHGNSLILDADRVFA